MAHFIGAKSANALLEELNDTTGPAQARNLRQMIGFDYLDRAGPVTLNQSNFSRANKNRSYRLWRYCFHQLWKQAKAHCQPIVMRLANAQNSQTLSVKPSRRK